MYTENTITKWKSIFQTLVYSHLAHVYPPSSSLIRVHSPCVRQLHAMLWIHLPTPTERYVSSPSSIIAFQIFFFHSLFFLRFELAFFALICFFSLLPSLGVNLDLLWDILGVLSLKFLNYLRFERLVFRLVRPQLLQI